jgi:hypothetical protein
MTPSIVTLLNTTILAMVSVLLGVAGRRFVPASHPLHERTLARSTLAPSQSRLGHLVTQ